MSLFLFKPDINQGSASLCSAFCLITVILHLQIILYINIMVQAKVNRELTSLGADLTSTGVHKGNLTCSKPKLNFTVQDTEENNVQPWELCCNDNENALVGTATTLSLLSLLIDNSNSQQPNQSHTNCYYGHTHGCFLDYFNDPIPNDAVIYVGDIPFQYNKVQGRHAELIGNLPGTVFTAVKRDDEFLISQNKNNVNMSSDSINFGPHNSKQNCTNFVQFCTSADTGVSSY